MKQQKPSISHNYPLRNPKPHGISTVIFKIVLILPLLIMETYSQIIYKFSQPVKSNKASLRNIGPGPLPGYFAQCLTPTECSIYQNQTEIWNNKGLSQAYIYSSQITRKVLVAGFVTRILDFSSFSTDIGTSAGQNKPAERNTNPNKILNCVFTQGVKWICLEGDSGSYIVYNMRNEIKEITFNNLLSSKLSQMNNVRCTIFKTGETIFCANLGTQSSTPVLMNLNNPNVNSFRAYPNDFYLANFPVKPRGAGKSGDLFAVWGGNNQINLSLFNVSSKLTTSQAATGKLLKKWKNPTTNPNFDLSDMSVQMGLFFLVNTVSPPAPTTQMIKITDGTVVKRKIAIPSYQLGISEVDSTIYGINGGKLGGNTEYIFVDLGQKPPNCQVFNWAVNRCARCVSNYVLVNGGVPIFKPGQSSNNLINSITCRPAQNFTSGGLLNTSLYNVQLEEEGAGYARIDFKMLRDYPPEIKKQWIRNFIGWRPRNNTGTGGQIFNSPDLNMDEEGSATDIKNNPWKNFSSRVVLEHAVDKNWKKEQFLEFYALDYPAMMERGMLPLKVNHLTSTEKLIGRIGIFGITPQSNTTRPLTKPLSAGKPGIVGNSGSGSQTIPGKRRMLFEDKKFRIIQGAPAVPNSNTSNPFKKNVTIPPFWKPSELFLGFMRILGDFIKLIINALQIFLVFIRPLSERLRKSRWAMWFASCIQALQIWLCLGAISGNFGGVIDGMQTQQLKSLQRNLLFDLEFTISDEFTGMANGANLGRLTIAKYTPSPIQETFFPFIILCFSLSASILACLIPEIRDTTKAFRQGATYSFMIPLLMSSCACIVTMLITHMSQFFGTFSFMVSIFLILYFIIDFLTTTNPCKGALNDQQQRTAEDIYPALDHTDVNTFPYQSQNEDVDFRSFDIDQKNTLGSNQASFTANFWEYATNLLTPIIIVSLLYAKGTASLLLSLIFLLCLFILCYQWNNRDLVNKGKSDTLSFIERLKSFSYISRLIYMAILLLFWAILRMGDLMTTQLFSTIAVMFVLMDLAFRIGILVIRILTSRQKIDEEWNMRNDTMSRQGSVRYTESVRLDSEVNHNPNLNSSGMVSDRSNPYTSPRIVRQIQPRYPGNVSPIVVRSGMPTSPRSIITNQYNPRLGFSGGKFPTNGSRIG